MNSDRLSMILFCICRLIYLILGIICFKLNINIAIIPIFALFHMLVNIYLLAKSDKLL